MFFLLILQIIGNRSEESPYSLQTFNQFSGTQVFDKRNHIKRIFTCRQMYVGGHKRLDKSFPHFFVGISQSIKLEFRIVALDGKIATLIKHRERISDNTCRSIKLFGSSRSPIQFADIEITLLQYVYQESRCSGRKPEISILFLSKCVEQAKWIVNIFTMFTKMIPVILLFQVQTGLLIGFAISLCHHLNICFQLRT